MDFKSHFLLTLQTLTTPFLLHNLKMDSETLLFSTEQHAEANILQVLQCFEIFLMHVCNFMCKNNLQCENY